MAITLLFYPWNIEKQEYSDTGIPFTFGVMNPDYYNKVAKGTIGGTGTDYGLYIDNVIGQGTNLLSALAHPSEPLSTFGITSGMFNGTEGVNTTRTFFKYKISDTLMSEVQELISIYPNGNGKAQVHVTVSIVFKSSLQSEDFWIHSTTYAVSNSITFDEFNQYCSGLNPIAKLIKDGFYFGLNAYPDMKDNVESSKTTTGCLIQYVHLKNSAKPSIYQFPHDMWGIKGSVVQPTNSADLYRFYIPEILGYSYEPEFPPSLEDNIIGGYNNDSDEGSIPSLPEQSAVRSGMVRLYQMTTTQLNNFARFLWNTDLTEWDSFLNTLKQWFNNPLDSIISLTISPVDVFYNYETKTGATPEAVNIKLGGFDTGVQGHQCSNNYKQISLGKLSLKPYYNSFLDTNPHTKFSLYLPYISFVDIDANVLFSKGATAIEIVYNIDVLTGVCVANILIEKESNGTHLKHVIYTFTGNMNTTIPISSANMKDFISASLGAVASAVAIGATGGTATPLVIGSMAAQQGLNIASQKVNVQHSGGMALEGGMFGMQYAYLIVTRPREARPSNYKKINGIPSEIGGKLSQFSGFTQVSSVFVNIEGATEEEKQQIEQLLKEGIIL